jgi:ABC-type branched-subunit amino acid transport system ATPase component
VTSPPPEVPAATPPASAPTPTGSAPTPTGSAPTPTGSAPTPTGDVVFDIEHVSLRFGGVVSLNDVSMQMMRGEILAVIGPNGAGKTSLFNSLTGVYTPQEGRISLVGRPGAQPVSVIGKKTHVISHLGVARTFQNIRLFPALTALENVKVGVETRQKSGPISAMLGMPWQRREERMSTSTAYDLLRDVGLREKANELAGSLAYGEQRRLEIARALGTDPGVLLLDEPAAGTTPVEKRDLAELIARINSDRGISVLLIEHDMRLVMSIAHRIVVLNFGGKIAEGTPQQIQRDPIVIAAYLGSSEEEAAQQAKDQPALHLIDLKAGGEDLDRGSAPATASAAVKEPSTSAVGALLDVDDIEVRYGAIRALKGVSFHVKEGEIVALLGANGAGKTTTQRAVSGMLRPTLGSITYDGRRVDGIPAHELIGLGICHVPEGRHVFPRMSVAENLEMGAFRFKRTDQADLDRVLELFPRIKERLKQTSGTLSGGEQQMLAIGRALMGKPRLILLDEPSMGLAPLIVAQIFEIIREINRQGVTVLLVEQNAAQALALADRGYVLETGEIVLEGSGQELLADDRIRAAYLGEDIVAS